MSKGRIRLPLAGLRILITRPEGQGEEIVRLLGELGASVYHIPTIRIAPPINWRLLDDAIRRLRLYDWVLFTSANGSRFFFRRYRRIRPLVGLGGGKIAVIGPKTREAVLREGFRVARMAPEYVAESLARSLGPIRGRRVLLVRAEKAREALPRLLRSRGAKVDIVTAYRTLPVKDSRLRRLLNPEPGTRDPIPPRVDMVVFTATSTVESMSRLMGRHPFRRLFRTALAASIGPVTTGTLRRYGVEPVVEAREYTAKGLVEAIRKAAFSGQQSASS